MTRYIIKTVDGNRYETDEKPVGGNAQGIHWMIFPTNDGAGKVYVNVSNIICVIEKEVEE